jgi:hypothetical protein
MYITFRCHIQFVYDNTYNRVAAFYKHLCILLLMSVENLNVKTTVTSPDFNTGKVWLLGAEGEIQWWIWFRLCRADYRGEPTTCWKWYSTKWITYRSNHEIVLIDFSRILKARQPPIWIHWGADKSLARPGRKRLTGHLQPRRYWPAWASNALITHPIFRTWSHRNTSFSLDLKKQLKGK